MVVGNMGESMQDKRKGWLRDLKVGDEVIVSSHTGARTIRKVDRITPSGLMDVGGARFRSDGSRRISDFYSTDLQEPTADRLAKVRQEHSVRTAAQRIRLLNRSSPNCITTDNADAVNAALDALAEAMGVTL
jgi:hypothetical protein